MDQIELFNPLNVWKKLTDAEVNCLRYIAMRKTI